MLPQSAPITFDQLVTEVSALIGSQGVVMLGEGCDASRPSSDRLLTVVAPREASIETGRTVSDSVVARLRTRWARSLRIRRPGVRVTNRAGGLAIDLDVERVLIGINTTTEGFGGSALPGIVASHSRANGPALVRIATGPAPGPSQDSPGALEWRRELLAHAVDLVRSQEGHISFAGFLASWSQSVGLWWEPLIVCAPCLDADPQTTPPIEVSLRAIIPAFNELDVLPHVVRDLLGQGVAVTIIDNWSTDGTHAALKTEFGDRITLERFPPTGPVGTYEWRSILRRVEEIAAEAPEDWVTFQDADEVRRSPWVDQSLPEALARVQRAGFTAVNHAVLNFRPVDDLWDEASSPDNAFEWFTFPDDAAYFTQVKTWRNTGERVDLVSSGGHEACFPSRRTYPWRFLMKHYPIRSQAHGVRKVLAERVPRWSAEERSLGWHTHYDEADASSFCWRREDLWHFNEAMFCEEFLVERLTCLALAGGNHIVSARGMV